MTVIFVPIGIGIGIDLNTFDTDTDAETDSLKLLKRRGPKVYVQEKLNQ